MKNEGVFPKKAKFTKTGEFSELFERELESMKKQFNALEKTQRENIEKNVEDFKNRVSSLARLLQKPKEFSKADEMLFSFEELPVFGKEYWFLSFAPTAADSLSQLVLTFGRATGEVIVNRKPVREAIAAGTEKECMAIGWRYSGEKKVFASGVQKVRAIQAAGNEGKNAIQSSSKNFSFSLSGNYPSYEIQCTGESGKTFFKAKMIRPPAGETPFEFASLFKGVFGFQLLNLYFDFQGELEGKAFNGKCYLQKVLGVGPFVPWRWARCVFQNGSVMEFFEMTAPSPSFLPKQALDSWYSFQRPGGKRVTTYGKIKIDKLEPEEGALQGAQTRWVASSEDGKAFLEASTYAQHTFSFENKATGKFIYEEHFAKANDFYYLAAKGGASAKIGKAGVHAGGKNEAKTGALLTQIELQTMQKTGRGICLFEDAYGFLL